MSPISGGTNRIQILIFVNLNLLSKKTGGENQTFPRRLIRFDGREETSNKIPARRSSGTPLVWCWRAVRILSSMLERGRGKGPRSELGRLPENRRSCPGHAWDFAGCLARCCGDHGGCRCLDRYRGDPAEGRRCPFPRRLSPGADREKAGWAVLRRAHPHGADWNETEGDARREGLMPRRRARCGACYQNPGFLTGRSCHVNATQARRRARWSGCAVASLRAGHKVVTLLTVDYGGPGRRSSRVGRRISPLRSRAQVDEPFAIMVSVLFLDSLISGERPEADPCFHLIAFSDQVDTG